jgi:hypothetical protein
MARRFNRKPLTDAERDARRHADRDRIEQAARALLTTDGWQRWIKVRASNGLSRYSLVISGAAVTDRAGDGRERQRHVVDEAQRERPLRVAWVLPSVPRPRRRAR